MTTRLLFSAALLAFVSGCGFLDPEVSSGTERVPQTDRPSAPATTDNAEEVVVAPDDGAAPTSGAEADSPATAGNDPAQVPISGGTGTRFLIGTTDGALVGTAAGGVDGFVRALDAGGSTVFTRQFGSVADDVVLHASTSASGSVAIAGVTGGRLFGSAQGETDAFVIVYDVSGSVIVRRQFGSPSADSASRVALGADGIVYVAGTTSGSVVGTSSGGSDVFLRAYNVDGSVLFTRQFGSASDDELVDLVLDPGGTVALIGQTDGTLVGQNRGLRDVFVRVYSTGGELRFSRQIGSAGDEQASTASSDGTGGLYVGGTTTGSLVGSSAGGSDAFVSRFDVEGTRVFTRQFGTEGGETLAAMVTTPSGSVAVAGSTSGALVGSSRGMDDAYVRVYGPGGEVQLTRQIGSPGTERGTSLSVSSSGDLVLAGETDGDVVGTGSGGVDFFVRRYDAGGSTVFSRQFGSAGEESDPVVIVEPISAEFTVAGTTSGAVVGSGFGLTDIVIRRYDADGALQYTRQAGSAGAEELKSSATY